MSTLFRRTLSTLSEASASASTSTSRAHLDASKSSTLPLAVRLRRAKFPNSPSIQRPLTPAREKRFQEKWIAGGFSSLLTEEEAKQAFIEEHEAWRSRVRGHNQALPRNDQTDTQSNDFLPPPSLLSDPTNPTPFISPFETPSPSSLTAQRIYLPNIQIRLMRNTTPPNTPYDPYVATFRIPPSMTKPDLRSYLSAVYGLSVTFIRTDNYIAPVARIGSAGQLKRPKGSQKTYKRAVVGLHEPFHYPDDMAELDAVISQAEALAVSDTASGQEIDRAEAWAERAKKGKEARQEWLNSNFMVEQYATMRKRALFKMAKGSRWRSGTHANKGNIVREIMKRRDEREKAVQDAVKDLRTRNDKELVIS